MLCHWGYFQAESLSWKGDGSLVVAMNWWLMAYKERNDVVGLVSYKFYFSNVTWKMSARGMWRKRKWVQLWLLTHLSSRIHAQAKTSLKWKWSGQGHGQNILLMLFNSCLEIQIMSHVHYWKDFPQWCLGTFIHNLFRSSKGVTVGTMVTIHKFVLMGEFQHFGNVVITWEWIIRINWSFAGPIWYAVDRQMQPVVPGPCEYVVGLLSRYFSNIILGSGIFWMNKWMNWVKWKVHY